MDINSVEPRIYETMAIADTLIDSFELDPILKELVRLRASQLNGCGYCIDYHTKNALKLGETAQRLFAVSAWWETPFFSEEEQAILKFTEEVTNISNSGVSDEVYYKVLEILGEQKIAQLLFIINTINCWNRICVSTHLIVEKD